MVMVEAPVARAGEVRLRYAAPSTRTTLTPQLLSKLLSSMEMTACRSTGGKSL